MVWIDTVHIAYTIASAIVRGSLSRGEIGRAWIPVDSWTSRFIDEALRSGIYSLENRCYSTMVGEGYMSGPDGSVTKRDDRRNVRRAQYEARQAERRRERERKIRRMQLQRIAIIGGSIVVFLLVGFLVLHAVIGSSGVTPAPHQASPTTPAGGDEREEGRPLSAGGPVAHYQAYILHLEPYRQV